jgi:hypothetical protein
MALIYNDKKVSPKEFAQIILFEKIKDINIIDIAKERNIKVTDIQCDLLNEQYNWLLERIYKILNVNKNIFKVQMIDSIIYDQEFKKLMKGE